MNPRVYWITGMSGAGKTTVASLLVAKLRGRARQVLQLDGDVLRAIFAPEAAHSPEERRQLAKAYGRLCREAALQGFDVVCATVSMFHEVREWNRRNIPGYREIYLRVPVEELEKRDTKGIYGALRAGREKHVVGMDIPAELPENPDLVIDNHGNTAEDAVERIWRECVQL